MISVIVPAYNEEKLLPATLAPIKSALGRISESGIIVVDNVRARDQKASQGYLCNDLKGNRRNGMKFSRLLIFVVTTCGLAAMALGQTVNPAKLKINGKIRLDSTYAQVVSAFGRPVKETLPGPEECTGGNEKKVEFRGLIFYFMDAASRSRKTYLVMGFDVTSPKFTVSGVKMGDSEAIVRQKFGRKYTADTDRDKGETVWRYKIGGKDGSTLTTVIFKKGKVVNIGSAYLVCQKRLPQF